MFELCFLGWLEFETINQITLLYDMIYIYLPIFRSMCSGPAVNVRYIKVPKMEHGGIRKSPGGKVRDTRIFGRQGSMVEPRLSHTYPFMVQRMSCIYMCFRLICINIVLHRIRIYKYVHMQI